MECAVEEPMGDAGVPMGDAGAATGDGGLGFADAGAPDGGMAMETSGCGCRVPTGPARRAAGILAPRPRRVGGAPSPSLPEARQQPVARALRVLCVALQLAVQRAILECRAHHE